MRRRTVSPTRARAAGLLLALTLAGCAGGTGGAGGDTEQSAPPPAPPGVPVEGTPPPTEGLPDAAEPQVGPEPTTEPPGEVLQVGEAPEGVVVDAETRSIAVATRQPDELVVLDLDDGTERRRTPLDGTVRHLQLAGSGGPVLVPEESAGQVLRVELPDGEPATPIPTGDGAHDATQAENGTVFVANEFAGSVAAVREDEVVKVFLDTVQPAGLAPVGDTVGMIDVRENTLTTYDAESLTRVGETPAGEGPTHLVADRHGRMIATDTRGDAVLVFEPGSDGPREVGRVEQAGGPYGIAYDGERDVVWVASSGTNEVVGYDMSDPTPREVDRVQTVQSPYTVGVDTDTGRLVAAGVPGGVLQLIDPGS